MIPDLSVIITAYNSERFIERSLESVLAQSVQPQEIIVIDDGSADQTAEIVQRYNNRVRYIYQENQGPSAARNTGIRSTQNEFIAFLDADDYWPSDKLERQYAMLQQNKAADLIWDRVKIIYESAESQRFTNETVDEDAAPITCLGAALFRRRSFEKVGLFDHTLRISEDWDWHNRAYEYPLTVLKTSEVALYYCRHTDNLTKDLKELTRFSVHLLKQTLDRRRQIQNQTLKS